MDEIKVCDELVTLLIVSAPDEALVTIYTQIAKSAVDATTSVAEIGATVAATEKVDKALADKLFEAIYDADYKMLRLRRVDAIREYLEANKLLNI